MAAPFLGFGYEWKRALGRRDPGERPGRAELEG
jgi:hypothetical protein